MQRGGISFTAPHVGTHKWIWWTFYDPEREKSCLVKPKLSLKPFSSPPSLLPSSSSSSSSSSPSLQSVWKNKKSSAVHLAAVLGGNTPSYSSASQAPVDNPFSHPPTLPRPCLTLQFHHNPPLAPIPVPGPRGGIRCQCPRKTPLSGTCGGSAAVLLRGLSFTVWDSHSSLQHIQRFPGAGSKAGTEKCSSFLTKSKNKNSSDTMKVFTWVCRLTSV